MRLLRRTSRPFWCFVFLSRCLIYKVHAPVSQSADVLFILALPDSFVKNFFQVFSKLFSSNRLISVLFKLVLASRLELAHFITHTRVCQALFSDLFSEGRPGSPRFLPVLVRFSCPLARRSDRIPPEPPFVNTFFQFSAFSFPTPVCHSLIATAGELCYSI